MSTILREALEGLLNQLDDNTADDIDNSGRHYQSQALADAIKAGHAALSSEGESRDCDHDWKIWPETDGQEQRCMKCGAYRQTPRAISSEGESGEYVLVPKEPTDKMIHCGQMLPTSMTLTECYSLIRDLWAAMLEAAPKREAAFFHLEHVATRLQMRVDAIEERGGETVGIGLQFAREIVRAVSQFAPTPSRIRESGDS